jgi:hypothetical protein
LRKQQRITLKDAGIPQYMYQVAQADATVASLVRPDKIAEDVKRQWEKREAERKADLEELEAMRIVLDANSGSGSIKSINTSGLQENRGSSSEEQPDIALPDGVDAKGEAAKLKQKPTGYRNGQKGEIGEIGEVEVNANGDAVGDSSSLGDGIELDAVGSVKSEEKKSSYGGSNKSSKTDEDAEASAFLNENEEQDKETPSSTIISPTEETDTATSVATTDSSEAESEQERLALIEEKKSWRMIPENKVVGAIVSNELLDEFDPVKLKLMWKRGHPVSHQYVASCRNWRESYIMHRIKADYLPDRRWARVRMPLF